MNTQIKNLIITLTLGSLCAPMASLYAMGLFTAEGSSSDDFHEEHEEEDKYAAYATWNSTPEDDKSHFAQQKMRIAEAFFDAIRDNNQEAVTIFLDGGVSVNVRYSNVSGVTPLMVAASEGHISIVNLLLARGANITEQIPLLKYTALYLAAARGHAHVIRALLKAEARTPKPEQYIPLIAIKNVGGKTLIMCAVEQGHIDAVKELVKNDQQPNNQLSDALQSAVEHKNYPILSLLLSAHDPIDNNCDIALIYDAMQPALVFAAKNGDADAINLLLQKINDLRKEASQAENAEDDILTIQRNNMLTGALLAAALHNQQDTMMVLLQAAYRHDYSLSHENRILALHEVVRFGNTQELIDSLLTHNVKVDECSPHNLNKTALMIAAEQGHESIVQFLLTKGASTAATDTEGNTALILAARAGNLKNVTTLVDYILCGENKNDIINHCNAEDDTALLAAVQRRHDDVATYLIECACLSKKTRDNQYAISKRDGRDALLLAAEHRLHSSIKALLKLGISINAVDAEGLTPLTSATYFHHQGTGTIEILLDHNADVHAQDQWGNTPLLYAKNGAAVKTLLHAKAHINHQNNEGETALIRAALTANPAITTLLQAKASVDIADECGDTALKHALAKAEGIGYAAQFANYGQNPNDAVRLLVEAGADPFKQNPNTNQNPWDTATPELRVLIDDTLKAKGSALASAYVLARDMAVLPENIACLIQQYATTEVPNQNAKADMKAVCPTAREEAIQEARARNSQKSECEAHLRSTATPDTAAATCCAHHPDCGLTLCRNTNICKSCGSDGKQEQYSSGQKGRNSCASCNTSFKVPCRVCTFVTPESKPECEMCGFCESDQQPLSDFNHNNNWTPDGDLVMDWSN